jgi:hypothetical protein
VRHNIKIERGEKFNCIARGLFFLLDMGVVLDAGAFVALGYDGSLGHTIMCV